MDYDGNDFQSQNFQLVGEENTKFPLGLHLDALPKFDLDDSLQIHLRFDGLVETEVLLGIQSQEENQWIEDFSRGSSGIEFSSSAMESCSISRCNNVWSEATSSESVEMLLNSVGQDEMIIGQTIIEESDACNELGSETNQMEPGLNQDGTILSKIGVVVDAGPALPPDKCLEIFSGLNKDAGVELPQVETISQSHEGENSGHESPRDLDLSSVSKKCGLPMTEGNMLIDIKCDDANRREGSPLADGSLHNRTQDDSTPSEMPMTEQNILASVGGLNNQEAEQRVTDITYENADDLQKNDDEIGVEHQVLSKEAQIDDRNCEGDVVETNINNAENPFSLALKADSTVQGAEGNAGETSINNVENLSSLALKVDSTVHIAEGCSEDLCSESPVQVSKFQVGVSSKDTEMGDQFIEDTHEALLAVVDGGNNSEGHAVEVSKSNAGTRTSADVKMDSLVHITHEQNNALSFEKQEDFFESDGHQLESGISVGNFETSMLTVEDNKLFEGQCDRSNNSQLENLSSLTVEVSSSANILRETQATENIKDGHDGLGVHGEDFNAEDHISSSKLAESTDTCERNVVIGPSDVHNNHPDVSFLEKVNAGLPPCASNANCEIDGCLVMENKVKSSTLAQSSMKIEMTAHEPPSEKTVGDELASSGVVLDDTNFASREKSDGVNHLLSVNGVAPDEVIEHKEDGKLPLLAGDFTRLDSIEESVTKVSTEPSLLALKECSQMENELVPVSESAQCAFRENAGQLLCETVGLSSSSMETISMTCQNEPQAVMANKATQEYSEELEVCPVLHDSNRREKDGAEVVGFSREKYEEASLKVAGTTPSTGETLTQTVPSSLEESSTDTVRKDQGNNETTSEYGDDNSKQIVLESTGRDALNGCVGSFKPASLSENNAESHTLEVGSRSPNSDEPNCGSPTVISSSEPSQSEKENRGGGNTQASDDIDGIANKVGFISQDPKGNDVSEDDRSFTFEVSSLASERETGKGWKPFPSTQPYEFPQTVEVSPSTTSGLCQMDPKILQENSRGSPRVSDGENARGSFKGTPERKRRRVSGNANERKTTKAGKPIKEIISVKRTTGRGGKSCSVSPSSRGTISQVVHAEKMRPCEYVEGSSTKPCSVPTIQTSNLPDLNTSASPSALFQLPFTDLQQVQLRAQIFVYGYLIQGTAPDEACMISAFGESDGGKSVWENVWRVAVERLHNQKSPFGIAETPLHSRSGARAPEQTVRQGALQNKALPTPVDRSGSNGTPSAIINTVIPFSAPLWNISTPSHDKLQFSSVPRGPLMDSHQALSPLHPYQSPHIRDYVGHNTPWLSQAPLPGPRVVSPQTSAPDAGAHYSAFPITETVHVTSVRESSVPRPYGMQHVPPSPLVHSIGGSTNVFAGTAPLLGTKKITLSTGKHASADPKSRKRRKSPASEELGLIRSLDQTRTEPVSGTGVTNHLSTSLAIITPANSASKTAPDNFITAVSSSSSTQYQIIGGRDTEQRVIFSEEMCSKIEQAKLQAEDAAALAATAVMNCQGIWSQLASQKNSGLVSDVESKLASAAVAVAAAASVAKAAAAAAKVASDAALQAKLMADEALVLSRTGNPIQSAETSISDGVDNWGKVTPASIFMGKDRTSSSSSIIIAAREASRRRVEAASAATKRAENLDAVVKAAGLTAEAVSQAGTIIAMGDPIPWSVSELIEAGPEGYWKVHVPIDRGEQSNVNGVEGGLDVSAKHFDDRPSNKKETQTIYQGKPPSPKKMSWQSVENHLGLVNGMHWDSATSIEKGLRGQKGRKVSDLAKTIGVVPESETGSRSASITVQDEEYEGHQPVGTSNENSITKGSHVEVLSDEDGLRRVWFSAKVLSLKEGKAYVHYTELLPDEGSRQRKEWMALEGEGDKAPRIRIAHPMTAIKFEGTRKRRRAAMGNYAWSVGDRVDAWIRDSWWEGIITEKSKEDETTLTVHFPAQGDTSIVRDWHLRPSLFWKDGQWMEGSSPRENKYHPHEGDTPQEKRLKLGSHGAEIDPTVGTRGKDKMSTNMDIEKSGKSEELRSLALSAKEKIFNVGKSMREDNKSDALRTRKEGSRVIIGVPTPGKKRKYMEVSKHYVADRSGKTNEGNDSIRFAKYLIPQGSGSRGWKNTHKIDSKEKQTAESKQKVLKSGKPQSVPTRSIPEKDMSLTSVTSASNDATVQDHLTNVEASISHDENMSEKQDMIEVGSFPNTHKAAEAPLLFSSLALPSDVPSSKKKSSSAVEADSVNKGKLAPSGEKLARIEEKDTSPDDDPGKLIHDVVEPRRSNRRFQPTSRLLEGLQSSLIISKIPAVSHDKVTKAQQRSASSSRGNNRS